MLIWHPCVCSRQPPPPSAFLYSLTDHSDGKPGLAFAFLTFDWWLEERFVVRLQCCDQQFKGGICYKIKGRHREHVSIVVKFRQ